MPRRRKKKAPPPEGFRACPECGRPAFYPPHGLDTDYHPLTDGPLRAKGVMLDIDGAREAEQFDVHGLKHTGHVLLAGEDRDGVSRHTVKVYLAHDCKEEEVRTRASSPAEQPVRWGIDRACPE